jgi:cytochrome-b5 reductase
MHKHVGRKEKQLLAAAAHTVTIEFPFPPPSPAPCLPLGTALRRTMNQDNSVFIAGIIGFIVLIVIWVLTNKKSKRPIALDPENWQAFPLIKIEDISHDVKIFRFGLQSPEHRLGLPIGQHISFRYKDENGKDVQRSYTPASSDDDLGHVDFVVKIYYKNVHPKFPEGRYFKVFV